MEDQISKEEYEGIILETHPIRESNPSSEKQKPVQYIRFEIKVESGDVIRCIFFDNKHDFDFKSIFKGQRFYVGGNFSRQFKTLNVKKITCLS